MIRAAALSVLLLAPGAAEAGWAYTDWGMSERDVVAASGGEARDTAIWPQETWGVYPALAAPFYWSGAWYDAKFYFGEKNDAGGLYAVRLEPRLGSWCPDLFKALLDAYGADLGQAGSEIVWLRPRENLRISMRWFSECWIKYEPLERRASAARPRK